MYRWEIFNISIYKYSLLIEFCVCVCRSSCSCFCSSFPLFSFFLLLLFLLVLLVLGFLFDRLPVRSILMLILFLFFFFLITHPPVDADVLTTNRYYIWWCLMMSDSLIVWYIWAALDLLPFSLLHGFLLLFFLPSSSSSATLIRCEVCTYYVWTLSAIKLDRPGVFLCVVRRSKE